MNPGSSSSETAKKNVVRQKKIANSALRTGEQEYVAGMEPIVRKQANQ